MKTRDDNRQVCLMILVIHIGNVQSRLTITARMVYWFFLLTDLIQTRFCVYSQNNKKELLVKSQTSRIPTEVNFEMQKQTRNLYSRLLPYTVTDKRLGGNPLIFVEICKLGSREMFPQKVYMLQNCCLRTNFHYISCLFA